jgi:hypothetical protein
VLARCRSIASLGQQWDLQRIFFCLCCKLLNIEPGRLQRPPRSAKERILLNTIFICDEDEMDPLDAIYQNAVDQEIDRLARLTPCELMQVQPKSWKVDTALGVVKLTCVILDGGDHRRIAVLAERLLPGFARRKFANALKVRLSCERLSSDEVADLYD